MVLESKKVAELKALLSNNGYGDPELDTLKGKKAVVEEVVNLAEKLGIDNVDQFVDPDGNEVVPLYKQVDFEQAELLADEVDDTPVKPKIPTYASKEWVKFVMDQFTPDELEGGEPTVVGLRRVANEVLGPIVFSGPISLTSEADRTAGPLHPSRATCVYEVEITWLQDFATYYVNMHKAESVTRRFRAAAGAYMGNVDDNYALYPEAMAETRAEGRALRKALGLKKNAAEETSQKSVADIIEPAKPAEWQPNQGISNEQSGMIRALCDKLNIDVEKLVNTEFNNEEQKYADLSQVERGDAGKLVKLLNEYQSEAGIESKEIPQEILK